MSSAASWTWWKTIVRCFRWGGSPQGAKTDVKAHQDGPACDDCLLQKDQSQSERESYLGPYCIVSRTCLQEDASGKFAYGTPLRSDVASRTPIELGLEDTASLLSCDLEPSTTPAARWILQNGKVVGYDNTVRKYLESKPVVEHATPFEQRVEKTIEYELTIAELPQSPDLYNVELN